jgi:hypothetical protein
MTSAILPSEQKSGLTGTPPAGDARPAAPAAPRVPAMPRLLITAGVLVAYYVARAAAADLAVERLGISRHAANLSLVAALLAALAAVWWRVLATTKAYHAPALITSILLMADAGYGILENHYSAWLAGLTGDRVTTVTPTLIAILTCVLTEMALGYFVLGKMPPLVSSYVSGISAGILIKSPYLWPFVLCGMLSITSKYVLRLGPRHLWNPTNFGVTMMLALAPATLAALTIQAGNEIWAAVIIWILGGMIIASLGLFHISIAFVLSFVALSFLRSRDFMGMILPAEAAAYFDPFLTEVAPITSPMFQLYIFFMITDPRTITKGWKRQTLVAVLVAVAETAFRLGFRDQHSLFHALFVVGPATNLIEMRGRRPLFVMAGLVALLSAGVGLGLYQVHVLSHALLAVAPAAWGIECCLPAAAPEGGQGKKE